jgi:hypothetical protein
MFNDEFGFDDPPGTLCEFAVRVDLKATDHEAIYSDNSGVVRIVDRISQVTTFTNTSTSTSVTRIGQYNVTSYPPGGSVTTGLFGRTLSENGSVLFTDAGRVVYNESFDIVFFTPHAGAARFSNLLCTALS